MAIDFTALKNACVLYYSMDNADISGSTILDLTPNNNDGTLMNSPTTGAVGILNEGISLDGVDDYIDMPNNVIENDDYFLSLWFSTSDSSARMMPIWISSNGFKSELDINNAGTGIFQYTDRRNGGSTATVTGTTNRADGNLHHIMIFSTRSGDLEMYVNGNPVDSTTGVADSPMSWSSSGTDVYLGARSGVGDFNWNGEFDEFLIGVDWTSAGTAQELADYFYNGGTPTSSQQYPFGPNATYAIEGQVTLSGTATQGATLRLYDQTGSAYEGSTTTDVNGNYLFDNLTDGNEYHVSVEYDDGTNKYNDESKPYIIPYEKSI